MAVDIRVDADENLVNKDGSMRDRLIDAAIESVYQNGFSETTVAKISKFADVSTATVHHHFAHKEDLLEQAMWMLLEQIHRKVVDGCAQAEGPRGKLWAVINAVLDEEQSNDRAANVWLSFWVAAEHFMSLRRVRNVYTRRLYSNVRNYLNQIFVEIGTPNPYERAEYGTSIIISVLHGSWLSFALKEEAAQDLERCRLMVWECLEMLLSRAREKLIDARGVVATSSRLLSDISIEANSADIDLIKDGRSILADNSRIFIPHFRNVAIAENIRTAAKILDYGLTPIAHVAARNIVDENELERIFAGFAGVGVREFLLIGGGESAPAGKFESALHILQTGVLQRHNALKVGFAGHPEEHPHQSRMVMRRALLEKLQFTADCGMESFIVTQFGFAVTSYFDFLAWLKSENIKVPVRLGLAGRVSAKKLFNYATFCGIGRSLTFFRRQFSKTLGLVNFSPEGMIAEMAGRIAVRQYDFPVSLHFYPFGAVRETLAVISEAQIDSTSEVT